MTVVEIIGSQYGGRSAVDQVKKHVLFQSLKSLKLPAEAMAGKDIVPRKN